MRSSTERFLVALANQTAKGMTAQRAAERMRSFGAMKSHLAKDFEEGELSEAVARQVAETLGASFPTYQELEVAIRKALDSPVAAGGDQSLGERARWALDSWHSILRKRLGAGADRKTVLGTLDAFPGLTPEHREELMLAHFPRELAARREYQREVARDRDLRRHSEALAARMRPPPPPRGPKVDTRPVADPPVRQQAEVKTEQMIQSYEILAKGGGPQAEMAKLRLDALRRKLNTEAPPQQEAAE